MTNASTPTTNWREIMGKKLADATVGDLEDEINVTDAVGGLFARLGFRGEVVEELRRQAATMTSEAQDLLRHRCEHLILDAADPVGEAWKRIHVALDMIKDGVGDSMKYIDPEDPDVAEAAERLHALARALEALAAPFYEDHVE
jgi:hypothetical protein